MHRVQRVPPGARKGRVHTSSVTVAVRAPEAETVGDHPALRRSDDDFVLEWYSGSGAGGQHRNRHANAARLRHLPTGTVVTAQKRKRPESARAAQADMTARLDALAAAAGQSCRDSRRAAQIGTSGDVDRARVYRFQDNRCRDARTGRTARTRDVLEGAFDRLWPDT